MIVERGEERTAEEGENMDSWRGRGRGDVGHPFAGAGEFSKPMWAHTFVDLFRGV